MQAASDTQTLMEDSVRTVLRKIREHGAGNEDVETLAAALDATLDVVQQHNDAYAGRVFSDETQFARLDGADDAVNDVHDAIEEILDKWMYSLS